MSFAATQMDLEIIILSQVSQRERQTPYGLTYMWNLQYNSSEYIFERETDSQIQRTDFWLQAGRGVGEDGLELWDQQMQTIICKMNKQQGATVQHRGLYSVSCDRLQWKRM